MSALDTAVAVSRPTLRQRLGKPFFVAMSLLLIATVVLGFSPTFFFRAYFDVPAIPPFLIVHGAVLSLWFVWMLVQTSLVAAHRTELHRRLGIVGVGIAVCVVAVTLIAQIGFPQRMRQLGVDFETEGVGLATTAITAWLTLLTFAAYVMFAVTYRRRPELHKRLMLWASLILAAAAGSRIPVVLTVLGWSPSIGTILASLLMAGPVLYDFVVRGRPHIVTVACLAWQLLMVPATATLAANETARAIVLSLG